MDGYCLYLEYLIIIHTIMYYHNVRFIYNSSSTYLSLHESLLHQIFACGAQAKPLQFFLPYGGLFQLIGGLSDLVIARGSPCDMSQGLPPAALIISMPTTNKRLVYHALMP